MFNKDDLKFVLPVCLFLLFVSVVQAGMHPLQIFNNPGYNNDPNFNLYINLVDFSADQVGFEVHNKSLLSSTITEVLFDDGEWLQGIAGLTEGSGTNFKYPAGEENLQGGNLLTPPFVTTAELSADRESVGGVGNGIDPDEYIFILFDLQPSKNFAQVEQAIESGGLRVGVHVQRLPEREGYSDSASAVTPEPAAMMLLSVGALSVIRCKCKGD